MRRVISAITSRLGAVAVCACAFFACGEDTLETRKRVAAELAENQLCEAAIGEYRKILDDDRVSVSERGAVAYEIGRLCFECVRDYEQAAAHYLMAKTLDPDGSYVGEANRKLVAAMERLGRFIDAERSMGEVVAIDSAASSGRVVARVGDQRITLEQIDEAIRDLPPQAQRVFSGRDGRLRFLNQFVGVELIRRAAVRAGYDKAPAYQRALDKAVKNLLVEQYMAEQIRADMRVDSSDVLNFYALNKDSLFGGKPYKEVAEQVFFAYQNRKYQEVFGRYVERLSQTDTVSVYEDSVR